MAKTQNDTGVKVAFILIAVVGGIALAVIIAAVVIMFFVRGSIDSSYTDTNSSEITTNTIEQNNAIVDLAIQQKDPALCDQINGETSVNMPLPGGNKVQTYDEATSKQRCKQQAEAGQPYVY